MLKGAELVGKAWMRDATHLAALVQHGGRLVYCVFDLTTFRLVASRPVAIG